MLIATSITQSLSNCQMRARLATSSVKVRSGRRSRTRASCGISMWSAGAVVAPRRTGVDGLVLREPAAGRDRLVGQAEHHAGVALEGATGVGELDAPAGFGEQLDAHLAFERREARRHRGLRHHQLFGGAPHQAELGDDPRTPGVDGS
ncbi:MAG: hypothetical protein U0Q03_06930 [Acidimicrobiales bacterium]